MEYLKVHRNNSIPQHVSQEYIPLRCVPAAAVAATRCWSLGVFRGGVPTRGLPTLGCANWGVCLLGGLPYTPTLDRMTDTCENITLPFRLVNMQMVITKFIYLCFYIIRNRMGKIDIKEFSNRIYTHLWENS